MDKLDDVERLVAVSNLSVSSFDDLILALRDLVTQNVPKQIHGELVPRIKLLIQATNTAITIQPNTSPELILAMTQLDAMDSTLTARLGDFLVKNPNVSIDNRNLAISTKAIALASVVSDSMSIHDMLISAKTNSGVGTTILSVIQGLKVSQSTATNARFLTLSGVLTNGDAKSKLLTIGADTVTINDSKYDAIATLITSNLTAIGGEDATAIDSAISSLTAIQNDWVAIEDDKYRAAGKAIFGFDPEVHKIVNEVQSTLLTRILQEHDAAVSYLQGVFVANRSIVVSSVLSHISASKASLNAFIGTEIQGILDANRTLVGDSQIATIRDDLVTKCGQIYDDINAFIRIDQDDLVALTQIILKSMYDYVDGRFNVLSNYTATSFVSMFEVIRVNMVSADLKNLFDEITDLKNQIQKLVRDSTAMQTSNPSITKSIMENMDNMNTLIPLIMGITAGYRPIEEYTSSETVKSSNPYAAKRAIPTFGSSGNEFADDDGFKKPVVHKSGPLSTEDEDRRLNQMYSAGDLDIDDPRSLVLLDQALALGSIDKRTFIIGFDDTIEYYRLGGMFAN